MNVSKKGIDLIKEFEGFYSKAYKCPAGVWTIGFGTTNSDYKYTNFKVSSGKVVSKQKAEEFLNTTLKAKYVPHVMKYYDKYHFNQNQFDALVSFCYNIGSIDQLVGNGSYSIDSISNNILNFNHCNGKVLSGLTRRRKAERELFIKPIKIVNTKVLSPAVNYTVNCDSLNVRTGPGIQYSVSDVIHKNKQVCIVEVYGNFGRISNTNNWVSISYLKKVASNSKINYETYIVNCDSLNIRSGPGVGFEIIRIVHRNNELNIVEKSGTWGRLSNTNNWVNLKYARKK